MMESKKYKIGDRLEIVRLIEDSQEVKVGDVGVVVEIDEDDKYPVRLDINDIKDYGFKYEEVDYANKPLSIKKVSFSMFINDVDLCLEQGDVLVFNVSLYLSGVTGKKFSRTIKVLTYNYAEERYKINEEIKSDLLAEVKQQVKEIYLNNKKFNLSSYRNIKINDIVEVVTNAM